jgi:hypothetical protein
MSANKDVIEFLEGNSYYAREEYIEFKDKVRKEKWGTSSFEEIENFYRNDKEIDFYFDNFLESKELESTKHKEFWPRIAFNHAPKYMYKILKNWKENLLKKEIINDFMRQINIEKISLNIWNSIFGNVGQKSLSPYMFDNIDDMRYCYDWQKNNTLTTKEGLETLKILIYFNMNLNRKYLFDHLLGIIGPHNIEFIETAKIIIDEAIAGRKISRFIINQMDDEFVLSPLRKKIELRRFDDLIKTNKITDSNK